MRRFAEEVLLPRSNRQVDFVLVDLVMNRAKGIRVAIKIFKQDFQRSKANKIFRRESEICLQIWMTRRMKRSTHPRSPSSPMLNVNSLVKFWLESPWQKSEFNVNSSGIWYIISSMQFWRSNSLSKLSCCSFLMKLRSEFNSFIVKCSRLHFWGREALAFELPDQKFSIVLLKVFRFILGFYYSVLYVTWLLMPHFLVRMYRLLHRAVSNSTCWVCNKCL